MFLMMHPEMISPERALKILMELLEKPCRRTGLYVDQVAKDLLGDQVFSAFAAEVRASPVHITLIDQQRKNPKELVIWVPPGYDHPGEPP
jgi:hypothetical protein